MHALYSLRWQIELMFKIWKSIFKIHKVKKSKIERFKCFLYGRLIALLISSSIVFTSKKIIDEESSKHISEIKSFDVIVEYFSILRVQIFRRELAIARLIKRIMRSIKKLGIKSKKKSQKTVPEILEYIKLNTCELEILAI
ncbi:transposase [Haloimpatiens sp. FM7315]|uniref:transposase n=1 Tax=Haloimpatiens sp. FM7315 TaxID=3298609 RepID=UPI0039776031